MKNFIFISPNFPENYKYFCRELKNNGINVLGIGDCPYDALDGVLRASLNEYYYVSSLENYDEVYRAVAFFAFKYGEIDFIESNNEYWIERDACLRTAFNVKTGFMKKDVKKIKFKSQMKKYFQKAGVKTARYCLVKNYAGCRKFIDETGYPVIVKPDNGVGAADTRRIKNDKELEEFFETKSSVQYIMEEYMAGEVVTYDAVIDSKGNPLFETGNVTPDSLMDVVNGGGNCVFYILKQPFEEVLEKGRSTVKAFGAKSRFVHFEFFRLTRDQHIGKKGEIVALEVNMRPSGGISPDMMNYANSTNVYKIWADMIAYDSTLCPTGEKYYCAFAGRRDGKDFAYSEQDILDRFSANIKTVARVPEALSNTMGNTLYVASFATEKEMKQFYAEVLEVR